MITNELKKEPLKIPLEEIVKLNEEEKAIRKLSAEKKYTYRTSMKHLAFCIVLLSMSINAKSQNRDDWKATDYTAFIDTISFKPVKGLKNYSIREIKTAILSLNSADIKQLNITGNYNCQVKSEANFEIWNLYYPKVSIDIWTKYCKGFIALMDLDGLIYHQ